MKDSFRFIARLSRALALVLVLSFVGTPAMAEEISIVGTGDGVMILKALKFSFEKIHPDASIQIPDSIGSSGGIKAVGEGAAILGRVARPIKEKERAYGLSYRPFALVPVVFFVNPIADIQGLSSEQVCAIYSGKVTNWKEVGGKDLPISVTRREDGDSSLEVLRNSFPGFKDLGLTSKALLATKTQEMIAAVEDHPAGIGFGPHDVAKNSRVKMLAIDGRLPTLAGYPSVNTLALIFKESGLSGNAKEFVEFATSAAAAPLLVAAGGVPLNH